MVMASSTSNQQSSFYGATAAPPPTPSSQPNTHLAASASATDALSRLLHRLPPNLSLPTSRPATHTSTPLISLSNPSSNDALLSAATQLGFFQLTHHGIPPQLASSAESEALSLFELTKDRKDSYFPNNWPLGFDDDDGNGESFWLDSACLTESNELALTSLRGLTGFLESLGLRIIEMISSVVGFDNPLKEDPARFWSLMRLHSGFAGDKPVMSGGFYPFIVGLDYQIRSQKCSLLADSSWVTVLPQVDSVLVTIGDIAQVWSNGKLKKVRGRPMGSVGDGNNSRCISMSLLVTLPTESTVSPLLPKALDATNANENEIREADEEQNSGGLGKEERLFSSFSFEDYAWRVYHEPLHFKDPLDKYRI